MINVRVVSKIYDNHSLSIVTRKLVLEFIRNNWVNLTIIPLDKYNPEAKVSKEELKTIKPYVNKEIGKIDIELRHTYPPVLAWPEDDSTKIVFIQPWEYNRMPYEWKETFQNFGDLTIVPSNWVRNVYINSGINPDKVKIIPNGYDEDIFNYDPPTGPTFFDDNKFVFTFVGNAQYRKGADVLMQAWHRAFVKADNAILVVKDTPAIYGTSNLLENAIQMQYKTGCAKIVYNDDNLSEEEMANMYKSTDVIVHPYRGEGFGMHLQEAMACGAMPMVTGVGAADDFITEENGIKINAMRNFIDANDPRYFIGKSGDSYTMMGMHFWVPEPSIDDLAAKMKFLYFHHERNKILERVLNTKTLTTWKTAAKSLFDELVKLHEKGGLSARQK
jgi:glycosyltransferase involved in cell wall biosynthesis